MTTYDNRVKHCKEIDIPAWQQGRGDWFTCRLFDLMSHADLNNLRLLGDVYPAEAEAFRWWRSGAYTEQRRQEGNDEG